MADHHDRVGVLDIVTFRPGEEAAKLGLHAQQLESVAGEELAPHALDHGVAAHGEGQRLRHAHRVDGRQVIAEVDEVEVRGLRRLVRGREHLDGHDAIGVGRARQRVEEDRPHPAEDRRVRADPERERENCRRREGRIAPPRSEAIPHVLHERRDERNAARVAAVVLVVLDAAELGAGTPTRDVRRDASRDQVLGVGLDVEAQLGVHVALHAPTA